MDPGSGEYVGGRYAGIQAHHPGEAHREAMTWREEDETVFLVDDSAHGRAGAFTIELDVVEICALEELCFGHRPKMR